MIHSALQKYCFQIALIFFFITFTNLAVAQIGKTLIEDFESSNLPIIIINTNGNQIQDEERSIAEMGIINNGAGNRNYLTDTFNDYDGFIAIELRGSSSSAYPKAQFRFETQDSSGENLNVSLCGLPEENDWILNGPYNDKSLIRNVLSYKISNQMDRYASRTVYCELILNGEYLGLYILMEKVKRDKNRVNISKLVPTDISGDNLTGGYIIKIDKTDGENVGLWFSHMGTPLQYHYPKTDVISQPQQDYIRDYFNDFEAKMNSNDLDDPENGYQNFIDVDSFVDHFILNEFCKNVDAYRLSAFLYKDRDSENPKLFAGPIWDFNLTFGDAWIQDENGMAEGWQVDYTEIHPQDPFQVPFWWSKLSRDYNFVQRVKSKWFELRSTLLSLDSLFNQIDSIAESIEEAQERNFQKWPGVLTRTHSQEITLLKAWILRRITWIDGNLDNLTSVNSRDTSPPEEFVLFQNYPNPFNPMTTIGYQIPNQSVPTDPDRSSAQIFVTLTIYDILGNKITNLVSEYQSPGKYEIVFDASGLANGVYFYSLKVYPASGGAGGIWDTKKLMLIK